jgi:hypothetical protein
MAAVEEVSGECKEGRVGLGQRTSWDCARPPKGLFWVGAFSLEGEGNGGQALHMPMHPFFAPITPLDCVANLHPRGGYHRFSS